MYDIFKLDSTVSTVLIHVLGNISFPKVKQPMFFILKYSA